MERQLGLGGEGANPNYMQAMGGSRVCVQQNAGEARERTLRSKWSNIERLHPYTLIPHP